MLQPTAVSSPAPASGPPSSPRTPRQTRKSGIALAIQNQARSQNQSQSQNSTQAAHPQQSTKNNSNTSNSNGGNRNGSNNSNNNNSNGNNSRQQRSPSQSHARHQSMPTQQRKPTPGSPSGGSKNSNSADPVTLLKRTSASVVAPTPSIAVPGIPILQNQGQNGTKQRNQQKTRPQSHQNQQQNSGPTSKSKRTQRRKDVDADTDLLEAALNQSPPLNPSSPPSSTDSDDSESASVHANSQPRSAKGQQTKSSGRTSKLSESPPRRPSSAPVMPQLRKGMPTMQRQQNASQGINGLQQASGVPTYQRTGHGSPSAQLMDAADAQLRRNATKTNSADRIMLADRVAAEKKSTLYAGPTFHNSPAPTSLPIPAFMGSLGGSFAEPPMPPPIPFFGEAASPQLNSMRPQRTQSETSGGWLAHQSMPGLSTRQEPSFNALYPLPERMAAANYTMESSSALHGVDHLTEISQNLRNLLKIQSQ